MSKKTGRSKSKGASKRKQADNQGLPTMRSFTFGIVVGIFLCLGAQKLLISNSAQQSTSQPSTELAQEQEHAQEPGPDIDFYTRLRDSEVLVPVPTRVEPREEVLYFLQAASFRNPDDAERARAEILLLNLDAEITEFHNNGETWHRIIVGPFDGQSKVSKAQTTLLENGYGGMVLQRKK